MNITSCQSELRFKKLMDAFQLCSHIQVKKEKNKRKKDITFKGRYSSREEKKDYKI